MKLCKEAEKGFTFQCQGCGRCCSNEIDGYVYLYMDDIKNMATSLQVSLEELAEKYLMVVFYTYNIYNEKLVKTGKVKRMHTLAIRSSAGQSSCQFLYKQGDNYLCRIYEYRPIQCSSYPFWDTIMTHSKNFIETELICAGFNYENKRQNVVLSARSKKRDSQNSVKLNSKDEQLEIKLANDGKPGSEQAALEDFKKLNVRKMTKNELIEKTMQERKLEREYYITMSNASFDIYKVYPFIKGILGLPESVFL